MIPHPLPCLVTQDGTVHDLRAWQGGALLPGSFNPLHEGHWGLARATEKLLGLPVAFELSLVNVDKPDLTAAEVERRLATFAGLAPVWLTRAATFLEKARLFREATFVVGADTALRLVQPRYYGNDAAQMLDALAALRARACSFLVAGRCDATGTFQRLADLPVPAGFTDLFRELPEELFRFDMSSTQLRGQ